MPIFWKLSLLDYEPHLMNNLLESEQVSLREFALPSTSPQIDIGTVLPDKLI